MAQMPTPNDALARKIVELLDEIRGLRSDLAEDEEMLEACVRARDSVADLKGYTQTMTQFFHYAEKVARYREEIERKECVLVDALHDAGSIECEDCGTYFQCKHAVLSHMDEPCPTCGGKMRFAFPETVKGGAR